MKDVNEFIEILHWMWMNMPLLFVVLEDKGGVGKSLLTQIIAAMLNFDGKKVVQMVDTDHANSSTAQVHRDTKMLDLTARVSRGILANVVQQLIDKVVDYAVVDVGAQQEKSIRDLLPWLSGMMKKIGGLVIVVRPLTTGTHNQRNCVSFMSLADEVGIPTVFVRNLGQGREEWRFDRWRALDSRKAAFALGAVETFLPDGDVSYVDESIGFEISLADVALRDFSKIKAEELEDARSIFDDDVCAFLNLWLRESMQNLGHAVADAIAIRQRLDGAKTSPAEPIDGQTRQKLDADSHVPGQPGEDPQQQTRSTRRKQR